MDSILRIIIIMYECPLIQKETPIHLYGSLLILPLISTYMIQDIWEYILLYIAFKSSF